MFYKDLEHIINGYDLNQQQAEFLLTSILEEKLKPSQIAAILVALRMKGESVNEILGFIYALRKKMKSISAPIGTIDTCGTGGDHSGSFNISTAVAFVVAGAGVAVAKHGNRSASSKCGSADVLEELGVNINLQPKQAEEVLRKTGIVFLFAQLFHPAFKPVIMTRKELGIRTIFNILGPFLNPADVKRQIIGVPDKDLAQKLADMATYLNYLHLLIIANKDGLDEIGTSSITYAFQVKKDQVSQFKIDPKDYQLSHATLHDIQGGDASKNASIITNILQGETGPTRDIVVLNAAYALLVSGAVTTTKEGIEKAKQSIDSGAAYKSLHQLITYSQHYAS